MISSGRLFPIIFLAFFFFIFFFNFCSAQRDLEIDYPEMGGMKPETTLFSLPDYAKYIFNFSVGIAGLVALIALISGGVRFLTSRGSPAVLQNAKDQMTAALVGILVLLGSYMILATINPQFIFFSFPERQIFSPEPIQKTGLETGILSYEEIPIGGLVEEIFDTVRLGRIKNISAEIKEASEEAENKSKELDSLVNQCSCSMVSPQCAGECSGGFCPGDPCPVRDEINEKREEIKLIIEGSEDSSGLKYWQTKLAIELEGTPAGTPKEEEIVGFRKVYNDLNSAEEKIKNCSSQISKNGKSQAALGYGAFWAYRQKLEDDRAIQGVDPVFPFSYIPSNNPYYKDNFFCTEAFYSIPQESMSELYVSSLGKELSVSQDEKTICGGEIKIGETVDNAQELAKRMLGEMDNINNNALQEIDSAYNLIEYSNPDNCVEGCCTTECIWIEQTCCEPCPEEGEGEEGEGEGEDGGGDDGGGDWGDWGDWFMAPFPFAFAQGCCYDCSYCEILPCSGTSCPGDAPARPQISSQRAIIQSNDSQIISSEKKFKDLAEEKGVENKLKISQVFKDLDTAQKQLGPCFTTKEKQLQAEQGLGKVLLEDLFACSVLEDFARQGIPFYGYNERPITDCYQKTGQLMDNFFCCMPEFSPE